MAQRAQRGIVTPEAVLLEFETAGVGSRTIAKVIDVTAQAMLLYLLAFAIGIVSIGGAVPEVLGVVMVAVGLLGVYFGYPVLFETLWNGRTPGKTAMGLRVVTVEGAPIRFRHAMIRAVVGIVDFWIPPGGATAIVAAILSRRTQRLGDMAAGTIVLRERSATHDVSAMTFRPLPGWEPYTASLDVAMLTPEEYGVVRSFLVRVAQLEPGARAALATKLATPVAAKLHHAPPAGVHPEHFLVSVAAAYQRRFGGDGAPPAPPPPPAPPAPAPPVMTGPVSPSDFAAPPPTGFAPPE
jgi:uncharacterized RDD family membrane protein YckC